MNIVNFFGVSDAGYDLIVTYIERALVRYFPAITAETYLTEKLTIPPNARLAYEWLLLRVCYIEDAGGHIVITPAGPRLDPVTETLFLIEYPQAPR